MSVVERVELQVPNNFSQMTFSRDVEQNSLVLLKN